MQIYYQMQKNTNTQYTSKTKWNKVFVKCLTLGSGSLIEVSRCAAVANLTDGT